jgi:hypothetical protein
MYAPGMVRRWTLLAAVAVVAAACAASPSPAPATPTPSASPSELPSPSSSPSATPTAGESSGPFGPLPSGCSDRAKGEASASRVTIADITTQTFSAYDVLIFDFDRGVPEYDVRVAAPPFTRDPSNLPLEVEGKSFVAITFKGASIVDEEFQPVYEGPTDIKPGLPRIQEVVMAGDFEAVSNWVVGLAGPVCVAVQALNGNRIVIAFPDAPG